MPSTIWKAKRERQYQHIKDSLLARGESLEIAEEIAARTVNKERARHGETITASASSIRDLFCLGKTFNTNLSSDRRGGLRSHRGPGGKTLAQLRNEAKQRGIVGRSRMNKAQLEQALTR
jgi:plasmid stabilization system protein ParE